MPVELSSLLAGKRWVTVEIGDNEIQVAYKPDSTSLRRQAEIQDEMKRMQDDPNVSSLDSVRFSAEIMCKVVCDWDLTRDGRPLPLAVDEVIDLPGFIFQSIMDAISADRQQSNEEKKVRSAASGAGLPVAAKPESARNGIPSLEQRGTWA